MFSAKGPPATWRGEECFASLGSASHRAMSVTGVVKFVSPVKKQKSTAPTGFAAITSACLRTELSVSFGALTFRFDSQVSMVKSDFSVTAANCATVAGRRSEEHTSELQSHSDLVC